MSFCFLLWTLCTVLGGTTGTNEHSKFTHTVSGKLKGAITKEEDSTSQTIFDEHNITELVKTFGKYPKDHFARKNEIDIDYPTMFRQFLKHLHVKDMMDEREN